MKKKKRRKRTLNPGGLFHNQVKADKLANQAVNMTKNAALTTMCTGKMAKYLKMGAIVIYHYYDSQGKYLRNLTIRTSYNDCVQAGLVR